MLVKMQQLAESFCSTLWGYFTNHVVDRVGSYLGFRSNIESLNNISKRLSYIAVDVEAQIKNGEKLGQKKRKREVENWLEEVQEIKGIFQTLEKEVKDERFISQFINGNRVVKLNTRIEELIRQSREFGELLLDLYETKGERLVTCKLIGKAFEENLEIIWNCIVNDSVNCIGIYGMGGVGKTALAKHIHNLLLGKSKYRVYWVSVSQDCSTQKLQDDIAKLLGVDLSGENDEAKRTAKLNRGLAQMKYFVLILDDVWESIRLECLGDPLCLEGCKLLITTRSLEVCRRIGCQEKIEVKPLQSNEALNLFRVKSGQVVAFSPQVDEIAKSIVEECGGLPLGIVTMAETLRGDPEICVWMKALTDLQEPILHNIDWEDKVLRVLKCSFDWLGPSYRKQLENNGLTTLQFSFLQCASLFEHCSEIKKSELIEFLSKKLRGEGSTRGGKFNQVDVILDKLVNVCLLERSHNYFGHDSVKMHCLIRAMAFMITRDNPTFKNFECPSLEYLLPPPLLQTEFLLSSGDLRRPRSRHVDKYPIVPERIVRFSRRRVLESIVSLDDLDFSGYKTLLRPLPMGFFHAIKRVSIGMCNMIKMPGFPLGLIQTLKHLHVDRCNNVVELFQVAGGKRGGIVYLPNLKSISLQNLPELKSICEATLVCKSLEEVNLSGCPKLKNLPFFRSDGNLVQIEPN